MSQLTCRSLVLVLLMTGLAAPALGCIKWTPYKPVRVDTERDPDKVYAAAVRVFLRKGWGFQQRDPNARAVETNWITYTTIGSHPYLSHRILVSSPSIELFTSCRMDHPDWGAMGGECPENQRPKQLVHIEEALIAEILKEADTLSVSAGIPAEQDSSASSRASAGTPSTAAQRCVPGTQISCACPAGAPSGIQVCSDDGARYLQCQCATATKKTLPRKP